jgi:hypothetical protein
VLRLAEIILPDGRNLNRELVRAGLAWWYERYARTARSGAGGAGGEAWVVGRSEAGCAMGVAEKRCRSSKATRYPSGWRGLFALDLQHGRRAGRSLREDPRVVARHPQDRLLSEELMQERREEAEMADRE